MQKVYVASMDFLYKGIVGLMGISPNQNVCYTNKILLVNSLQFSKTGLSALPAACYIVLLTALERPIGLPKNNMFSHRPTFKPFIHVLESRDCVFESKQGSIFIWKFLIYCKALKLGNNLNKQA